jgi:HEAT repeat protein
MNKILRNPGVLALGFVVLVALACWWTWPASPRDPADTVDELVQALDNRDPSVRMQARVQLIFRKGQGAVPKLVELLESGTPAGRFEAAVALCRIRGKARAAAVPGLIKLIQEGDLDSQRAAAETLGSIGADARPAVAALEQVLLQQKPHPGRLRPAAVVPNALVRIQREEALPFLIKALEIPDSRIDIVMAIESLGSPAQPAADALKSLARVDPALRDLIDGALRSIGAGDPASGT